MQLRQMVSASEREIFGERLEKARATRGVGFRETARSRIGQIHLMFGDLYALFANDNEPAERMIGGFIVHDLGAIPQSHPKPELSHLRPSSVIEGGELWSLSSGVFRIARRLAPVVAGIKRAQAVLVYPMVKPIDLTGLHRELNFVEACEPVRWPWVETLEGGEVWTQPLILQGEALENYVREGFDLLFRGANGRWSIPFDASIGQRPASMTTAGNSQDLAGDADRGNGAAAAAS